MSPRKRARILDKIRAGRASRIERLTLKQEGLCFYCWTDLEKDVTKEHLASKANGGGNEESNLRAAHMVCNGIVGSLPVEVKLRLHEIGREKGAEAFWTKAREYQAQYTGDRNAYRKHKPGALERTRQNLANARRGSGEEGRDLSPEEADLELQKLTLGQPVLSKGDRERIYQEEVERRKKTGLPVQIGFNGWMQLMEQRGWCLGLPNDAGQGLEAA